MVETAMEPWSFTIVFDEDKAKKNGYEVDTLYDYVGKNVEGLGNERVAHVPLVRLLRQGRESHLNHRQESRCPVASETVCFRPAF